MHPFTIVSLRGLGLGVAAATGVWLATLPLPMAAGSQVVGPAEVLDGDTLTVGGLRVRLHGADAPESGQQCGAADGGQWPCGAEAAARLAGLVAGASVTCTTTERDLYGRVIAACSAGGRDLGATMVREGLAWAYVAFSDAYVEAEAAARAAGRGIWQGPAQVAWDWRRDPWQAASGTTSQPGAEPAPVPEAVVRVEAEGCRIKGNIGSGGARIYHMPASPWYDRVTIDAARGQRWFCSATEAEAAGWRAAGGGR